MLQVEVGGKSLPMEYCQTGAMCKVYWSLLWRKYGWYNRKGEPVELPCYTQAAAAEADVLREHGLIKPPALQLVLIPDIDEAKTLQFRIEDTANSWCEPWSGTIAGRSFSQAVSYAEELLADHQGHQRRSIDALRCWAETGIPCLPSGSSLNNREYWDSTGRRRLYPTSTDVRLAAGKARKEGGTIEQYLG